MPWVRAPGIKLSAIMRLLVGGVTKVGAPPWEAFQELVFASSFCGCSILSQATNHGNSRSSVIHCGGYTFALVVNDGSLESQRLPLAEP